MFSVQPVLHPDSGTSARPSSLRPSFDDLPADAQWIKEIFNTFTGQVVVPECAEDCLAILCDWVALEREMGYAWVVSAMISVRDIV